MTVNEHHTLDEQQMAEARKRAARIAQLARSFSPNTPVTRTDLFAKRGDLMEQLFNTLIQPGAHAVIYGERGVGKTSLISVMSEVYRKILLTVRVNCTSDDDYSSIWRNIFDEITVEGESPALGFTGDTKKFLKSAAAYLPGGQLSPNAIRKALEMAIRVGVPLVIYIDEFDRVMDPLVRRLFADTIKMLSDYGVGASIVLVGVADNVTQLISEHQSISRNLTQMLMPRMFASQLAEILDKGMTAAEMTITAAAKSRIINISRGLPHYTHSLGLYAARYADANSRDEVTVADVDKAIKSALETAQEYVQAMYEMATHSAQKANYERVLLACALAPVNERGSFAPADVRDPLSKIMKKRYEIPNFSNNLTQLTAETRGIVLERVGTPRAYRYRFRDPLLQPYVVLRGIDKGLIKSTDVK